MTTSVLKLNEWVLSQLWKANPVTGHKFSSLKVPDTLFFQ